MRRSIRLAFATLALVACSVLVTTAGARVADSQGTVQLNVFAAASLTEVLPRIDPKPKYNFAASNTLASQIRQGAPADVYAAASTKDPQLLFAEGLCDKPVTFAYNKLVVIVPRSNPAKIKTVFDLKKSGVKVVLAAPGVPVGEYARQILKNLGISAAVLANVVSNEPDVKSVVGKVTPSARLTQASSTGPTSSRSRMTSRSSRFPGWSQPPVRYQICVVTSSPNKAAAKEFVDRVLGPPSAGATSPEPSWPSTEAEIAPLQHSREAPRTISRGASSRRSSSCPSRSSWDSSCSRSLRSSFVFLPVSCSPSSAATWPSTHSS